MMVRNHQPTRRIHDEAGSCRDARCERLVGNAHEQTIIGVAQQRRSEEHTSELQSLMRISYAVFCLKKKKTYNDRVHHTLCTMIQNRKTHEDIKQQRQSTHTSNNIDKTYCDSN